MDQGTDCCARPSGAGMMDWEEGWQSGGCRRLCFGKVDDDELPGVSVVRLERLMLSSALLTTNGLRVWVWCV